MRKKSGNPVTPEGVQVGFIVNYGSIWRTLNMTAGTYNINLRAAQRATSNSSYQKLNVKLQVAGGLQVTSTKQFIWDGNALAEERNASNSVTRRFYPQGEEISGTSYYYTRDHLNSVRELVDSTGAVRARYDYTPGGYRTKLSGDLEASFAFTGHYFHANSSLNLALYRAYDYSIGRWLSRDPTGEEAGPNLYEYVQNDPMILMDPLGLREWFATSFGAAEAGARAAFARARGEVEWGGFICKNKCRTDGKPFYYTDPKPGRSGPPPKGAPLAKTYSIPAEDYKKCDDGDEQVALYYGTPDGVSMPDWDKGQSGPGGYYKIPFMLGAYSPGSSQPRLIPYPPNPNAWPK